MKYKLIIEKAALRFIKKQPEPKRLLQAIGKLPDVNTVKLSGKLGLYRLRVGSYRIIFSIDADNLLIKVVEAGNRGDVYK